MDCVDTRVAAIAGRQHGVIKRRQLLAAGLTDSAVCRRVERGLLHRVFIAVYAVGHPALSRESRWMAAALAGGQGAALSHLSAAGLLGIWRGPVPPDADVVAPRGPRSEPGLRIHRCRRLDGADVTVVDGIPVTTVPRTLIDLSDSLDAMQLANLIHEAAYRRCFDLRATRTAIERANGRRNLAVLARALEAHETGSAGTRSADEDELYALILSTDLPVPLVNVPVHTAGGPVEVDFHWPDLRLCVELDGPGHARPRTRRDDQARDLLLRAAGQRVLRIPYTDRRQRPQEVLDRLREAITQK
jgi:Protein of unknown function (DUF559)